MNKKVAIVGHSQIPEYLPDIVGVETRIFRLPGGRLHDVYENEILNDSFKWSHDMTIIFLGGNDVTHKSRELIVGNLLDLVEGFKNKGSRIIVVVLIEPRTYHSSNRFGIDNDTYKSDMFFINRKLKRLANSRHFKVLNINARPFQYGHVRDGVHFDMESKVEITKKLVNCIIKNLE